MISSWDVRDRLGTQWHWEWGTGVGFTSRAEIFDKFRAMGARHLRTWCLPDKYVGPDGQNLQSHWWIRCDAGHPYCIHSKILEAWAEAGARFLFSVGLPYAGQGTPGVYDRWYGAEADTIDTIARRYKDVCVGLECPNEYDNPSPTSPFILEPWDDYLRGYVERIGFTWKSNPAVNHLPVLGPSLVHDASAAVLGSLEAVTDAKNVHPYTANVWASSLAAHQKARLNPVHGVGAPIWATEFGKPAALLNAPAERAQAIVLVKQYLSLLKTGFERAYVYAFVDTQQDMGMLRDDLSERPVYTAFKKLLSLCDDTKPGSVAPPLSMTVTGAPPDLKTEVAYKANGKYLATFWREAPLGVAPVTIKVEFPTKTALCSYDLISGAEDCPKDRDAAKPGFQWELVIADDPLVLKV